jgi:hypothetical protein
VNNENKAPVLTLEHLVPYLPYGLKCEVISLNPFNKKTILSLTSIVNIDWERLSFAIKPILRPMSEITVDFFKENIDEDIVDFLINCEPEHNHFSVEVCDKFIGWTAISYEEYQLFFKNHFDVFGLIQKGLAIDINLIELKNIKNG